MGQIYVEWYNNWDILKYVPACSVRRNVQSRMYTLCSAVHQCECSALAFYFQFHLFIASFSVAAWSELRLALIRSFSLQTLGGNKWLAETICDCQGMFSEQKLPSNVMAFCVFSNWSRNIIVIAVIRSSKDCGKNVSSARTKTFRLLLRLDLKAASPSNPSASNSKARAQHKKLKTSGSSSIWNRNDLPPSTSRIPQF